jgi:thiol-disulfide isomerase/thioredoxin
VSLALGSPLVPFKLKGTDGRLHASEDFPGVLVVAWWCNHCPYVLAWEQRTIDLAKAYAGRASFVAINSNDPVTYPTDDFEHMAERAKAKGYPFPYLYDETQELAKRYGATRTPEFFVFDAGRALRYHGRLDDNHENPRAVKDTYLRDALDAILAGKEPALRDTPPKGCSVKWKAGGAP